MRLIYMLFRLPFWVFLAAAGGLFYLGELAHRDTQAKNDAMAQALAGTPPATVGLADFTREGDVGLANEISVQGVINPDYNYQLTKRREGVDTVRYMYVLFDPADGEASKVARGAMVLTEAEKDKFINEYYLENAEVEIGAAGFVSVVTFNGLLDRSPDLSSMVRDAFDEQGLTKSYNFVYLTPFLNGREAGLTPTVTANEMRNVIRGVGLALAVIGLGKFALRRRKKPAAPDDALAIDPGAAPLMAPVGSAPQASLYDTPEVAPADPAPKLKKSTPIKLLLAIALIGVAAYTGQLVIMILAALVIGQIVLARKAGKAAGAGLSRLGLKLPGRKSSDEAILASVQSEAAQDEAPAVAPATRLVAGETRFADHKATAEIAPELTAPEVPDQDEVEAPAKRRGFKLPLPSLARRKDAPKATPEDMSEVRPAQETAPARPRFKLPIPALKRKTHDEAEAIETPLQEAPEAPARRGLKLPLPTLRKAAKPEPEATQEAETPKRRGFKLPLPGLRKSARAETDAAPAAPAATPRRKEAFQNAPTLATEDGVAPQGLGAKLQLALARPAPAEREPKAFAGRPDPFDRLAAEAQRSAAR